VSYFANHFNDLHFTLAEGNDVGLRKAQLGAIFAVGSHFSVSTTPGLVIMPTGSGKTSVLLMTPFVRRKAGILVVTTSRLVRSQITDEIESLETLKMCGVFPRDMKAPNVYELNKRIQSATDSE
jgi:superfamily II DNA or RNA helicase